MSGTKNHLFSIWSLAIQSAAICKILKLIAECSWHPFKLIKRDLQIHSWIYSSLYSLLHKNGVVERHNSFPFKVAKALSPEVYRNVEFESWKEAKNGKNGISIVQNFNFYAQRILTWEYCCLSWELFVHCDHMVVTECCLNFPPFMWQVLLKLPMCPFLGISSLCLYTVDSV